jgi:putative transposase
MRPSRFSEEQIRHALHQVSTGTPAVEVCRTLGITQTTFYRWRSRYPGAAPSESQELRALRSENHRLREIVADLLLEKQRLVEKRKAK